MLLEMKGITKIFPGVRALNSVDFDLNPGEVHILLGENGAGKSTLMKIIAGAYTPDAGTVTISGKKVENFSPRYAQNLGVGIIYQEFNLVPYLNVAQNIYIDHMPRKKGRFFLDHRKMHKEAEELLESLNMQVDTKAMANDITVAQQQMVEVAKALTHDLKILIMDEPTSSLSEREIEQLFKMVRDLANRGIGIIYISHRLQEIPLIGDRVTILRDGNFVGTSKVSEITTAQMVSMMVGREVSHLYTREYQTPGDIVLEVQNLSSKRVGLKSVTMEVRKNEIIGLAGLVGSGRTELARAIFQVDPFDSGEINLFGQCLEPCSPKKIIDKGVSLLPEDRKRQGLSLIHSVSENVVISSLAKLYPRRIIDRTKEKRVVSNFVKELRISTPSIKQLVMNLSGGNQQKVVLAKWLCTEAEIFIFDEPTRGIDVGAKGEIYAFMDNLVKQGKAVIMISSELPEIIGMSDRIYVMREGAIVAHFDKSEVTQQKIIAYAMGGDEKGEEHA